ncbi:hypothetical protein VFPPC_08924 [Pochonia chlamydosporia 170]|uniref:Uncharacterized protein n=1 Tax=Pochonia chlamydosporia 170 TaxID=1380566 RepID=A0A179FCB5_METCM|nr:hypothetical protein VFPPC_08924 [Pochonia chlamydosporia 170]OAQ63007.2 hypothetical protein VFPPC_08924 [Pochonia chlamydosporia 170]
MTAIKERSNQYQIIPPIPYDLYLTQLSDPPSFALNPPLPSDHQKRTCYKDEMFYSRSQDMLLTKRPGTSAVLSLLRARSPSFSSACSQCRCAHGVRFDAGTRVILFLCLPFWLAYNLEISSSTISRAR